MSAWSKQIFMISLLLLCCAGTALAQDAGMSDLDIPADVHDGAEGNATYIPGEEVKYIPRTSAAVIASDSISLQLQEFPLQRAPQRPSDKNSEKQNGKSKDDSILTFNFLYYIIQKYKLQDIID